MSKLKDLASEKYQLSDGLLRNTKGGRKEQTDEGKTGADKDGEGTGDAYSTVQGVTDHCDFATPNRDWVEQGAPCGVAAL